MISKYPTGYYRVSLKALIKDKNGHVLVVKEESDTWSLPGGGLDHGESIEEGLKRELFEEVLITAPFTHRPIGLEPMYASQKEAWFMWAVYALELDEGFTFGVGVDANDVAFMDPAQFAESQARGEKLVHKWSKLHDTLLSAEQKV